MKIKLESIHDDLVEVDPQTLAKSLERFECSCSGSVCRDEHGEGYVSVTYWSDETGEEGPRHWVPAATRLYDEYTAQVRVLRKHHS